MDRAWWNEYLQSVQGDFELWTSNREAARVWKLNFVNSEPGGGVSDLPHTIRQGGNSGFQAVGLALYFGAAKIILLGYDMQLTASRSHWHGDHKKLGNPVRDRVVKWRQRFAEMSAQIDVEIINATRDTALTCFPRKSLAECLA